MQFPSWFKLARDPNLAPSVSVMIRRLIDPPPSPFQPKKEYKIEGTNFPANKLPGGGGKPQFDFVGIFFSPFFVRGCRSVTDIFWFDQGLFYLFQASSSRPKKTPTKRNRRRRQEYLMNFVMDNSLPGKNPNVEEVERDESGCRYCHPLANS